MRSQIKVALGLVGFLLTFLLWTCLWLAILGGLGVSHQAQVPIILYVTATVFFASMPRIEPLMDRWAEAAPEWRNFGPAAPGTVIEVVDEAGRTLLTIPVAKAIEPDA
jgi:hypothetical protein